MRIRPRTDLTYIAFLFALSACGADATLPTWVAPVESWTDEDARVESATRRSDAAVPKEPTADDDTDEASEPQALDAAAGPSVPSAPGDRGKGNVSDAGATGSSQIASGLPCEIDAILTQSCRTCHGKPPIGGAPMSLLTYAELTAPSPTDKSKSNAQRSSEMMQNGTMPPAGALAAADTHTFAVWVQAGAKPGSCGSAATDAGVATSDPYDTPVVCTSKKTSSRGEGPTMRPGNACISCHSRGEGPRFALAGTVYPTAHEPNDCNGTDAEGATVVVTDANGTVHKLAPNAAGNFYASGAIALPYTASVTAGGRTRAMAAKQTNGDCNSCHTQDGAGGAPGRVMLP